MDPELQRKRQELERRLAADKRRFPIITAVFVAAMIVILFVAFQFPGDLRNPAILVGVVMIGLLTFAVSRLFPGVACPGCERTFDDDFGAYCPECGAHGLKVVDKHYKAECRNCEKNLAFTGKTANGRRRLFKIRFCTNCGLSFGQRPL
jgi:hypothetical protein